MAKKDSVHTHSVGWLFWGITLVLLAGPCIYLGYQLVFEDTLFFVPISLGLILAALLAGLLSWAVNAVLQRRNHRARLNARKAARKK